MEAEKAGELRRRRTGTGGGRGDRAEEKSEKEREGSRGEEGGRRGGGERKEARARALEVYRETGEGRARSRQGGRQASGGGCGKCDEPAPAAARFPFSRPRW